MQVIGLCRFSYPAIGGFQVDFPTFEDKLAYLYSPQRMEERFRYFETLTLPPLIAQTDPDFTFLVVIGESLPPPYLERLRTLLAPLPQAELITRPPGQHRAVMEEVINGYRDFGTTPCLQFRMDDDDAVAVDFVARLREAAQDARPLIRKNRRMAIDFNRGYIVRPDADGLHATPTTAPYTTAGLGLAFGPRATRTVMNFAHVKVAQQMPTLTLTDSDMVLRGHNDHNDSRQKPSVKHVPLTLMDPKEEAHIKRRFNVDADHIRAVFSRPA